MKPWKIAVIGGGSTYTPELMEGLIHASREIPMDEVVLMDIDPRRLDVVGGLACRMVAAAEAGFAVRLTEDRSEALVDASHVITQIRVGGMQARVLDERIPLRYDVVGQETTGPGGFAKALRTIPVMLDIASDIERLAPNAWLINFTNPSGLITEALLTHSHVKTIGLCNSPTGMRRMVADALEVDPGQLDLDYVGLNHLSWIRSVRLDGEDVTADVLERVLTSGQVEGFEEESIRALGMLPSYYLEYYYATDCVLAEQKSAAKTRGEVVMDVERALLEEYADPSLAVKPAELEQRGGAHYASAAVSLLRALEKDTGETHIVNARNWGAIADLPADAVVEVPCEVRAAGAAPRACGRLPDSIRQLVLDVKAYERLTIEAAVTGDRERAVRALASHPLVPSSLVAEHLWKDLHEAHRQYLPHFEGGGQ